MSTNKDIGWQSDDANQRGNKRAKLFSKTEEQSSRERNQQQNEDKAGCCDGKQLFVWRSLFAIKYCDDKIENYRKQA